MSEPVNRYVVFYAPHGVPQTVDGEWAMPLSIHDSEKEAEAEIQRIKSADTEEYSWLGNFITEGDDAEWHVTDRGLRLDRYCVPHYQENKDE